MNRSEFVYTTYIKTTPEKLWDALTNPEFTRQYWFGAASLSDWKPGSTWKLQFPDGKLADAGEILECEPPRRLVLKWRNEWSEELKAEGFTRCEFDISMEGSAVKLTVTHSMDQSPSKMIGAVSGGWPKVLSNLKSLLEIGEVLMVRMAA